MRKSISSPNLQGLKPNMGMRKSISTNALPEMNIIEAVIMTKAPINQSFSCLASTDFPDNLLKGRIDVDKELVSCLASPCDPPVDPNERTTTNILGRNYAQLAVQNEANDTDRYNKWFRRLRKKKNNGEGSVHN